MGESAPQSFGGLRWIVAPQGRRDRMSFWTEEAWPSDGRRAPQVQISVPALLLSSAASGVRPISWILVGALYAGLVFAVTRVEVTPAPTEPWPDQQTSFELIFEPAPTPQAAVPSASPPATETPDPAPAPVEASEAAAVAPEPTPLPAPVETPTVSAAVPQPAAITAPPAPPPKPAPPRRTVRPPAVSVQADSAPSPSEQVATLPPAATLPLLPPRPISAAEGNLKPAYPAEARRRGWQGRVVLHVDVSAAGMPTTVHVISSSGHSLLDDSALHTVESWRFIPATRGDTPVAGGVDVPVQFRLAD